MDTFDIFVFFLGLNRRCQVKESGKVYFVELMDTHLESTIDQRYDFELYSTISLEQMSNHIGQSQALCNEINASLSQYLLDKGVMTSR